MILQGGVTGVTGKWTAVSVTTKAAPISSTDQGGRKRRFVINAA